MKKAKVISFESLKRGKTDSTVESRKPLKKPEPEKMTFVDHFFIFVSDALEIILFPFLIVFNLLRVAGTALLNLFRRH